MPPRSPRTLAASSLGGPSLRRPAPYVPLARSDRSSYVVRVKQSAHPDFYRLAPPPGASRESTIRPHAGGRFWHDGDRVSHPALEKALHSWISRHPDDGRLILTNGYDWTYFQVD